MLSSEKTIGNVLWRSRRRRRSCQERGGDIRAPHEPLLQCLFTPLPSLQYQYFSATADNTRRLLVLKRSRCQKCSTFPGLFLAVLWTAPLALSPCLTSDLSRILSSQQTGQIFKSLPARVRLEPWGLLYTLSRDGCSLNNLLTKLRSSDNNILLVIEVSQAMSFKSKHKNSLHSKEFPLVMCTVM